MTTQPITPRSRRGPDWWLFLTKFFRHGTAIGAVAPSSSWLARKFVQNIDFSRVRCVVELGAGTGPITAELLRQAGQQCRAVIVERDPDFCACLRRRFPAADIAEADACDLERILDERKVEAVDHVLCGLALPWFARGDRHRILDTVRRRLVPEGSFRQLTYMPWLHTREYRRYFAKVGFRFVLRNLPPAGFYVCTRPLQSEVRDQRSEVRDQKSG
jgi:phospholipid N-methyltransferase